jgi:hypothetical protein
MYDLNNAVDRLVHPYLSKVLSSPAMGNSLMQAQLPGVCIRSRSTAMNTCVNTTPFKAVTI